MKPIDFRNEKFASLRDRLHNSRAQVYLAWVKHGPGTTRQVAERSRIDILTLRPRTTELLQMGALTVEGSAHEPGQGVYRARSLPEWEQWLLEHRASLATTTQQQLM